MNLSPIITVFMFIPWDSEKLIISKSVKKINKKMSENLLNIITVPVYYIPTYRL